MITTTTPLHELTRASHAADDAWMAELYRLFGRDAGHHERYSPEGKGEPGSHLRALYDAKVAAAEAAHVGWEHAIKRMRERHGIEAGR